MNPLQVFSEAWLGNTLGALGVGLAFFFYKRGHPHPRLSYQMSDVTVVGTPGSAFEESVTVNFSGSKVPRITATSLYLWNDGNTTLDNSQAVASDPLRIKVQDGDILSVERRSATRPANNINVSVNGND